MGIHVLVVDKDGKDHPDWDWVRHAGDRDIPMAVEESGVERIAGGEYPENEKVRPLDVWGFVSRMCVVAPENTPRWLALGAILADRKWWLRYSI